MSRLTFCYKHELDPDGIPQFGLIAEQVEKVNPDLVAHDAEGKPYTVRYEAVNAMLLNEFLKAHKKIEEQDRKVREQDRKIEEQALRQQELEATITQQQRQIEALTANLQRVSDRMGKPAPQLVADNQ